MLTKSYKDYLREQDLLHQIKEGDYLHIITEDGVETIRFDEGKLGSLLKQFGVGSVDDLLKKIPSIGKKSKPSSKPSAADDAAKKPDAKKPKAADKADDAAKAKKPKAADKAKKPKAADKAKGGKRSSGLGRAAGAAGLGGLLGGLLGGDGDIQSLFKQGYDIASNQFVGKNPITESLNKSVTEKFTDDVAHFVLDLR
jgi:hypothetical protein